MNDLRYAIRMLLKSPAFTAVAVLSLGLGIGANTTVFCWIENMLLRPLSGVDHCERIVALTTTHGVRTYDTVSLPDLKDYSELNEVFAGIIGSQVTPACLSVDGKPEWAYGQIATANFFDVLGVKPLLGRTFLPDEDQKPGGNTVLVISYGYWQRRFGGNPHVIGSSVEVNQYSNFTIIGVAPQNFHGTMSGLNCDFWAPLSMHQQVANFGSLLERTDRWLHTQARLRNGVSLPQAQAAVNIMAQRLAQAYPDADREIGLRVLPLWKAPYGAQALMLPVLRILMVVSVGVLLIVAANVANLLLARATSRGKEIAVRLALGAKRARLIRQLLTESLVLALVGGIAGVLLANWGISLFAAFLPQTHLPVGLNFGLDGRTLFFTLLVTLGTGVAFGLVPAWKASSGDLHSVLKEGGRGSGASGHHRLRSVFVVTEVALALLLLVGAGLCIKGSKRARQLDIGFDPHHVLVAGLRIGMNGYDRTNGLVFYRTLHDRIKTLAGVDKAALASWFPLGFEGGPSMGVDAEGYARKANEDVSVPFGIVSPDYFSVLRIPIVAGRDFQQSDDADHLKVAIVNETMAKRFWPGQNPLGRKFKTWRGEITIVGVSKAGRYRSLNEPPQSFFYLPYQQGVWDLNLGVALRTAGEPNTFIEPLRKAIHDLDPRVEVWANLPMNKYIEPAFLAEEITTKLLTGLGAIALILAAMGIYGVMSYAVSQRTQEIGVRMALGAQVPDVLKLVVGQGMTLGGLGVAIGVLGALALTRLMASFLYGVSPFDPLTFLGMSAVLGSVTFLATVIPACRAAKVDPQVALRYE